MTHPIMQVQSAFSPAVLVDGVASPADVLLRFRLPPTQQRRRPLNISLVIDRSGSMAGQELKQAILAAKRVVDDLDEHDLLSVVIYDDSVETLIAPTHVTDKAKLKSQLDRVRAGGLTNLSGGWLRGVELVQQGSAPEYINRVLLLTDGQANVGVTDVNVLTKTAAQKAESGISTTTLGFGRSFNEDLLIGMARAAGGNFYFIQSIDDAAEVFGIELQTLKAVAAQNLTVTLEPAAGVEISDVLSLNRQTHSGAAWTLELGDIYEDEDKLLGLRLALPALAAGTHSLFKLSYRAEVIDAGQLDTLSGTLDVQATAAPLGADHAGTDLSTVLDLARLRIARAKEQAVEFADNGKAAEAVSVLRDLAAQLSAAGLNEHFEITEELEQLEHYALRISARRLDNESRKELRDQSFQGRGRGREDLLGRGVAVDTAVFSLPVVDQLDQGVELVCLRSGGKLRIKVVSDGFDEAMNVQFSRALRADGAHYLVDNLVHSADGSFYRTVGTVRRIVRAGETDPLTQHSVGNGGGSSRNRAQAAAVTKAAKTATDLETTDSVKDGVLLQCVKEGSKLRARVVQDGFHPDWNMRFPRSIREDGMLYVVDEVTPAPDGKSYIASGAIRRFVQPS